MTAASPASDSTSPSTAPRAVIVPCTTSTVRALAATPHPNDAAKAIAAKPSRVAFR